jgi:hypothetical protein
MTYNRTEATPIAGEHCRFGGDAEAPWVETPGCEPWICCDTVFCTHASIIEGPPARDSTRSVQPLVVVEELSTAVCRLAACGKMLSWLMPPPG